MKPLSFNAFRVWEEQDGLFRRGICRQSTDNLPKNGVLVKVEFSSLNYKDALSATGNKGVTRHYPHTPGIDAAGTVVESISEKFQPGDKVLVTGYDLGMNTPGGFGEYIDVPAEWIVPIPVGINLKECMILGTAGFTAALSVHHLLRCGQRLADGKLLVTGATGGVGSLAVAVAAKLGFEVIASSGKPDKTQYLLKLGAKAVIGRNEADDNSGKALLRPRWAAAIDTVGGNTLATILKSLNPHGSVAACGNVASPLLQTTVFPFIINGVNLLGVNSATTPMPLRRALWEKLADEWKPDFQLIECQMIKLPELDSCIEKMLLGKITGRVVIAHADTVCQ